MIKQNYKYLWLAVVFIFIQVYILNQVMFNGYINPYFYIMLIICFPQLTPKWFLLVFVLRGVPTCAPKMVLKSGPNRPQMEPKIDKNAPRTLSGNGTRKRRRTGRPQKSPLEVLPTRKPKKHRSQGTPKCSKNDVKCVPKLPQCPRRGYPKKHKKKPRRSLLR